MANMFRASRERIQFANGLTSKYFLVLLGAPHPHKHPLCAKGTGEYPKELPQQLWQSSSVKLSTVPIRYR